MDGKQPGEDLRLSSAGPTSLRVEVEARCLIAPMEKVEIVVNGRVVESIPAGQDKHHIRVDTTVSIDRSSWIAARVVGPPHRLVVTDEQVLAHTSPVYSYLGEQEISSPADALYFVNWIDDLIRKVEQHGVFSKLDHKYEIIQLFRKAQDIYARKAQSRQLKYYMSSGRDPKMKKQLIPCLVLAVFTVSIFSQAALAQQRPRNRRLLGASGHHSEQSAAGDQQQVQSPARTASADSPGWQRRPL